MHVLTAHPYAFAKKSPTGESPSRHPSTRTDENQPAGLLPRFGPNEDGREERDTTPNPAQKPRRGRRVSVPSPSRSLSRCEHARINPHPPSPAIRPRGGAEAARPFAHSRGKRRGAFAQPCGLPTPLALASAARARRRRNASRHVSSSTSARDGHHPPFAASIPRLTILPPPAFPSPPGATQGRGENSPCQSRASDSLLEEVASRLVSRTTRRCRRRPR